MYSPQTDFHFVQGEEVEELHVVPSLQPLEIHGPYYNMEQRLDKDNDGVRVEVREVKDTS